MKQGEIICKWFIITCLRSYFTLFHYFTLQDKYGWLIRFVSGIGNWILAIGYGLLVMGNGIWAMGQRPARVPAYQGVIERIQPNGDTVYVRLHGDERNHWMTLEDGKTLVKENKKGYICYAKKKKDGRIVATWKKVKQSLKR